MTRLVVLNLSVFRFVNILIRPFRFRFNSQPTQLDELVPELKIRKHFFLETLELVKGNLA